MDDTNLVSIIFLAVMIPAFGYYFVWQYRISRNGEWQTFGPSQYRYRRYIGGKWQYRDMTPSEAERHQLKNAL